MANYTVKFKHVNDLPSAGASAGEIYFAKNTQIISVWGDNGWENYGGNVLNATYSGNILTITKVSGENVELDFSDVASSSSLNAILVPLRQDVNNLQTATGIADGAVAPSWSTDANYLEGSTTLKAGIEAVDAQAKTNATAIAGEETRAKAAEQANATAISAETTRATDAETALDARLDIIEGTGEGSVAAALEAANNYTDTEVGAEETRAKGAEAALQTAIDGKVASVSKGDDGSYFTTTIGGSATAPTVAGAVTVQEVSTASTSAKGLAEASDVKGYVDGKISTEVSDRNTAIETAFGTGTSGHVLADNDSNTAISSNSSSTRLVTAKQVADFASGVTGAMHFRGVVTGGSAQEALATVVNPVSGDVVLYGTSEYVYSKPESGNGSWQLFGDEGVYATQAQLEAKIEGLDATVGSTTVAGGKHVAVQVVEADGVLTGLTVTEDDIASAADLDAVELALGASTDTANAAGTAFARIAKNASDIATLNGTGEGSVSKAISDKIDTLDATVGSTEIATNKHVAVQVVETDGKLTGLTVTESDIASADDLADEITRAKGVEGSLTGLTTSEKGNLVAAINEVDAHADANASAISTLNGDATTTGSVAKAVADEATRINGIVGTPDPDMTIQGEIDALEALVGTTSVDSKIAALDATVVNSAADSGSAASSQIMVQVVETDGKLTSVSVTAPAFDAAGAAATVKTELIGTAGDTTAANTINGAKNFATNADTQVKTDLVGNSSDTWADATAASHTIYAVKNYADNLVANGLAWDWDTTA